MAAGYALGPVMRLDAEARRQWLMVAGASITVGFLLLRALNLYGDPQPWTVHETWSSTVLSFLNCEKYPPSLLFLMMTLGPALIVLAIADDMRGRLTNWLTTYGRVSFFFYVTHIYLIHGLSIVFAIVMWSATSGFLVAKAPAVALSLAGVYVVWLFVLLLLYPLCLWFATAKQRHSGWWWSYL
jgi:uncharacterized membrane protein